MTATLKLRLLFTDRHKIVEDIAKVISGKDLNIVSMEVENQGRKTLIYMETAGSELSPPHERIIESLKKIPDLLLITRVNSMPQEIREKRLEVILDSISDGIVSIDRTGRITFINPVAKKMYGWDHPGLTGTKLTDLPLENRDILDCLEGKSFHNRKRNVITPKGRFQFFSAGIAIEDAKGEITDAVEIMRDMKEIQELADEVTSPSRFAFSDIIGTSAPLMDAISFAQKISASSSIVSIRGESGTGKELFARAIHNESGRQGQFVPVNCAALPESLLESELFGYEKGSFTGAGKTGKQGLFKVADQGTLFLDEIAEMSLGAQAKILRVIQEKRIRPIGGIREIPVDTRIITATSRLIEQMIKNNQFREDLYYRINVLPIHVPPLRERRQDIRLLAEHFLSRIAGQVRSMPKKLSRESMEKLMAHHWPGNVRELKNVIERGAIISDQEIIEPKAVLFGHEIKNTLRELRSGSGSWNGTGASLKELLAGYEQEILASAILRHRGIRKTARILGISHTTLINKMKKYNISHERSGN